MTISAVRIVLVAPAGPLNVGSVARVMKNFGLSQLVLVSPACDPLGAEALQMAVHAKDILEAARQVKTVPQALAGCRFAIATTARARGFNAPLEDPQHALPTLMAKAAHGDTALIFGPEDRGLSNEELTYAQRFIKIPTEATYSALNLAQAVAVCCYELHRVAAFSPPQSATALLDADLPAESLLTEPLSEPLAEVFADRYRGPEPQRSAYKSTEIKRDKKACLSELEGYYQHLERVLLKVEYLYSHTATSRMRKFRQLLNRAEPTSPEVAMLRGILRQTEWALSNLARTHSDAQDSLLAQSAGLKPPDSDSFDSDSPDSYQD